MIKYRYKILNGEIKDNIKTFNSKELSGEPTEWRFVGKLSDLSLLFEQIVQENESFTEDEIINGKK